MDNQGLQIGLTMNRGNIGRKKGVFPESLIDLVFSWSLEDIFNDQLYKDKVENIPQTFESVGQYLRSFIFPLKEETRAELCSSMDDISEAPHSEIISLEETKPYGNLLYKIKIDSWNNGSAPGGKESYKPKGGDMFVLSDIKPESVADLSRFGRTFVFASVTKVDEDGDFIVRVSKDIEVNVGMSNSLFAVFLVNTVTNNRIWMALHTVGNLNIIKEVLCIDSTVGGTCDHCCAEPVDDVWTKSLHANLSSQMNESQISAVLNSISVIRCHHRSSVKLIWGPPGTGKTKTVSTLLCTLLTLKCRTLACAPTNVAVLQVASYLLRLVKEFRQLDTDKNASIYSLGDVIIFGSKDRMKVDNDLLEVFLDHRVDCLSLCFAPLTGWKPMIFSMIDFLENCLSIYHMHLENKKCLENEASKKDTLSQKGLQNEPNMEGTLIQKPLENVESLEDLTFLEFIKKRFRAIATPLRSCVSNLCTHLTSAFISKAYFQNMNVLLGLLDSFENLISRDDVVEAELKEFFLHSEVINESTHPSEDTVMDGAVECSTSILLNKTRCECLVILRSLQHTSTIPHMASKGLIREFCLKTASLIFCTASSSYKLNSVEIEPIDLLVIDEAAQLKECETLIPLQVLGIQNAILIGDECQLSAMVHSKFSEEACFGRSLFQRLSSLGQSKHLLDMQYRMHPSISSFPNSKFYSSKIWDAPFVKCKSFEQHYLPGGMYGPYSFINISDGKEVLDDVGHSLTNMVEVAVVMEILRRLSKAWATTGSQKLSVGVIAPYSAQVFAIKERLGPKYEIPDLFSVTVNSIDGFQGGEKDVIILSTVRSNSSGSIGFMSDLQRTNVALTRARHCLWILGNEVTLIKSGSVWETLVRDAIDRRCFFNADEDKGLTKAILNAKQELEQFDDLLNGDSLLFKNARWKVLFSDIFRKSFSKLKSTHTKKAVINILLRLAGGWRPKKLNVDFVSESSLQLVKLFKVVGLYLICTIDIVKQSNYIQVLKIWDILHFEEIPKLVKRLEGISAMYTDDYVTHCNVKCLEGNLEVPMSWTNDLCIVQYKNFSTTEPEEGSITGASDGRNYVENSKVSESLLLMKFYALSSGVVGHLLSGRDGMELDLPFEVTDQELDMIRFPRSTFILGRSGTGKTTVLTMKLIQKEQQHYLSSVGLCDDNYCQKTEVGEKLGAISGNILRQIFVTVSPKLCSAVKNHICQLKSFICGGDFSTSAGSIDMHDIGDSVSDFAAIPDSFSDIPPKNYPLVITFQKFLMMLDGSMVNSFFDKFHDVRELSQSQSGTSRSLAFQALIMSKQINYDRFSSFYWPHFNIQLTKKLDSSTVFTEIISHIKGGLAAFGARDGKLSREDYIKLSEGRVSSLSRERREIIYDLFLDYEKKKMMNGDFDLADLVIDIHARLRDGNYIGQKMDFVYIDEVQDLTMRQIALFKHVCYNFEEGFVFSGDTAQTIARGIDFRFQDIRSLFYKEFLSESIIDCKDRVKGKGPRMSDIFHLNRNFRTHVGVLNLAQSVVDLLYCYFPLSIDVLSPETSLIFGEVPVLLESGKNENAMITIFGNAANIDGGMNGFGAEQVILVRDDCAKKEIFDHVGKQALVLTIVECKGLEFQDVLLYNFFGAYPLKNQWRVIYEYMQLQNLLDANLPRAFPSFEKTKHNILCSELKQLYVAITRTRQRLWICENFEENSKPMFDYWKKLGLVQVKPLDDSLAQAMRVASSKEEWKVRGIKLFNEENFEMATMCFERAGDLYREKLARAFGLRASADRIRCSNFEKARVTFLEAAEIYETIGRAELAANCYIELKEFKKAGTIYLEKCGESRLEDAGDCFSMAKCWSLAAEVYAKGYCISKCLSVCTKGQLFDMGLQFIGYWKENANSVDGVENSMELNEIKHSFLERCAIHYHELRDSKGMMKFVRAFSSLSFIRTFLKSRNYLDELILVEEEAGNIMEAASIARVKGDLLLEANLLEKAGYFEKASRLILFYIVVNSLWTPGSKGWPLKQFIQKDEWLMKAKLLAEKHSVEFYGSVCMETGILSDKDTSLSQVAEILNAAHTFQNVRVEVFAARKILDFHLMLEPSKFQWESKVILDQKKHANEMMSWNQSSAETFVYFWNIWKDKILKVLAYLRLLGTPSENEYVSYGELCLEYLGVRKQDNQNTYVLVNSEACWIKGIDPKSLPLSGNSCMDARQFVSAAQTYWGSEILSVGVKVLERLKALNRFAIRNSSSVFCQGIVVLHIFEVSKFLIESELLGLKYHARALQNSLAYSKKCFFDIVFPLDWRETMMENMIDFGGKDVARELLTEVLTENINLRKGRLTHGEIGRVVMLLFVSRTVPDELYQSISNRFDQIPPWKDFIEQLKENMESGFGHVSPVSKLQGALECTFLINWEEESDYISPHCYVYLIERLLFLVSSCQGYFFTTRSSCVERLRFQEANLVTCLVTDASGNNSLIETFDFVAEMVKTMLNRYETLEWIRRSKINAARYYPSLVLQLIIMISLVYLNTGQHFGLLANLLRRKDIISELPPAFCKKIQTGGKANFLNIFAEALEIIENPLVVVGSQMNSAKFLHPNALLINTEVIQCREDVVKILFPKKPKEIEGQDGPLELEIGNSCHSDTKLAFTSELSWKENLELEVENKNKCDLQKSYGQFWEAFDVLQEKENGEYSIGTFSSNVPPIKLELEKSIHVLLSGITCLNEGRHKDLGGVLLVEMKSMLVEMQKLSVALDMSKEVENNISEVGEMFERLRARRPRLQPLLDSLFLQNEPNIPSQNTPPLGLQKNKGKQKNKSEQPFLGPMIRQNEPNTIGKASQASASSGTQNPSKGKQNNKSRQRNKKARGRKK
ncbi:uncharacterized protein LOC143877385 isoform X2 [Tasmannia lanceolata]|uniref:uncharacterized protein LOC143877385 isoform X2 n=1 Tax=Tasmannia lanceolata TaxID=3420 RepID=UPI004062B01F